MTYVVKTEGRNNMSLFLVDRKKIKDRWWSYDWNDAIQFHKEAAAQIQAAKLKYKLPKVISIKEAIRLSKLNDLRYNYDSLEHPFSSEGLGQN